MTAEARGGSASVTPDSALQRAGIQRVLSHRRPRLSPSSFFNVSTRRFHCLSCKGCGHTEFFNTSISGSQKFLDFLGG
jgi:hypothetical protein